MANKALATRQRMQFRVEPSQAPAIGKSSKDGRGSANNARKTLPAYLGGNPVIKKPVVLAPAKSAGKTDESNS